MIVECKYDETTSKGLLITKYEAFDSDCISRSECDCYSPKTINTREACDLAFRTTASCKFFDKNGELSYTVTLPNESIMSLFQAGYGLNLSFDGSQMFVHNGDNELCKYSIGTGKILAATPLKGCDEIFLYKDKLFCACIKTATKGSLQLVGAETIEPIKEIYSYGNRHPIVSRLNERFLAVYVLGRVFLFDMDRETLQVSKIRFDEPSCFYGLSRIIHTNNSDEVIFRFEDWVTPNGKPIHLGGNPQWVYSEQTVRISDLFDGAKPYPLDKKLPMDKKTLEKI
ncbi:hypothetical protein FACS1894211_02800 [Clostridia bacterium]|nr:hypothetical protein FACS1894211_02800 [Clostridia bacterium]